MSLLFIDYRDDERLITSEESTLFGFITSKIQEKIVLGKLSILKTISGSSVIKFFKAVIIIVDDTSIGAFIVSNLQIIYPDKSFNYLTPSTVASLFPEMIYVRSANVDLFRDFSLILPNLYISSMNHAHNKPLLDALKIYSIVNVAPKCCSNYFEELDNFTYLTIDEDDRPDSDMIQYFNIAFRFIDRYSKHNGVLVHCMAGVSRSATVVIAYIMKKLGLSCTEASKFVQDRHPIADPNIGFMYQLEYYEKQLRV